MSDTKDSKNISIKRHYELGSGILFSEFRFFFQIGQVVKFILCIAKITHCIVAQNFEEKTHACSFPGMKIQKGSLIGSISL